MVVTVSAEEITQALAGRTSEEVVVPETPGSEFVASQLHLWKPVAAPQAPEFVAAPTALLKNQLQLPQAPEVCLLASCTFEKQSQLQFKSRPSSLSRWTCFQAPQQAPATYSKQLINKLLCGQPGQPILANQVHLV